MAGSTTSPEVQIAGGFRIESSTDKLTVTKATLTQTGLWTYLTYAAICGYVLVSVGRSSAFFLFLLLLAAGVVRYLFVGVHNFQCTRETLKVIDVFHGRENRTRSYKRGDVKGVRFGAVSFSRYGATGGLIFEVGDERVKALYGLKCVEAEKVLDELNRLALRFAEIQGCR